MINWHQYGAYLDHVLMVFCFFFFVDNLAKDAYQDISKIRVCECLLVAFLYEFQLFDVLALLFRISSQMGKDGKDVINQLFVLRLMK